MKVLMALIVATLLALPASAGSSIPQYWNCMQIGYSGDSGPIVVVSNIQNGNKDPGKHYKTREKAFATAVKKKWNLHGTYEPLCSDYHTRKDAESFYTHIIKQAKERGLTVWPIEFKWREKDVPKKGQR